MDPVSFFESLNVEFSAEGHHSTEGWIQLKDCPGCGSSNYHLGFNLRGRFFSCWKCGGLRAKEVLDALGATAAQKKEFYESLKEEAAPSIVRVCGKLKEPKNRGPLLRAHCEYLRERHFDPEEIKRLWEIEGIGPGSRLFWRIYIPVVLNSKRVSWTTRAIGKDPAVRYISAAPEEEAVPHKCCLYGADYARQTAIVVEGPTDVWRVGPGAVGTFGIAFTTAQVKLLSRYVSRFILYDNEPKAKQQAAKLADLLSPFPGKTTILECDAKDPGSMKKKDIQLLRKLCGL